MKKNNFNLSQIDPNSCDKCIDKEEALKKTEENQKKISELLYLMFAENKRSLLIILHGIDASGKDGTINKLFSGVNPQGIQVHSFKTPSEEELRYDFLWRCHVKAPQSGMVAVFNRSYYEEVGTVSVHPGLLKYQHLPDDILKDKNIFQKRFKQINNFEEMLAQNGTIILKFMLHISKEEQKERLAERLKDPNKYWKFSASDIEERKYWNQHRRAFQKILDETSTALNPWHVIPANKKWYRDFLISEIILQKLESQKMKFPKAIPNIKEYTLD